MFDFAALEAAAEELRCEEPPPLEPLQEDAQEEPPTPEPLQEDAQEEPPPLEPPQEDAQASVPNGAQLNQPGGGCRQGEWIESVSTSILREGRSLASPLVSRLPPFSLAQVLHGDLDGQEDHRVRVSTADGQSGWVSLVSQRQVPLWRPLAQGSSQAPASIHGGSGEIRFHPFIEALRNDICEIERQSFNGVEKCLERWITAALQPSSDVFVDVATAQDASLLAYCAWQVGRCPEPLNHCHHAHILSIAVAPDRRGRRIGERLLGWVQARGTLRFPNLMLLSLFVREDNASAFRLYERCGFTVFEVRPGLYGDCDGIQMILLLGRYTLLDLMQLWYR